MIPVRLEGSYHESGHYPLAMVNVTDRCNLACSHCFIYRDDNPNEAARSVRDELPDDEILETLAFLKQRHGIEYMLWMGGEPLLRRSLLEKGVELFPSSTVTALPCRRTPPTPLACASAQGLAHGPGSGSGSPSGSDASRQHR